MTKPIEDTRTQAQIHYEAACDVDGIYTIFRGWVLSCLFCDFEARGKTKTEALAKLNGHLLPFNVEARP